LQMKSLSLDDFVIKPVSGGITQATPAGFGLAAAPALAPEPLGPLAHLRGTWKGTGLNQIWRPFQLSKGTDRFLELNETTEVLQFVEIDGDIPNRGLLQADILLHGLTYLQKISDVNVLTNGKPTGIHIEPGIWVRVPGTTDPQDADTVARLATIPHGTSLVAQGTAKVTQGPPVFASVDITPFAIAPPHAKVNFPEQDLSKPSAQRTNLAEVPHFTQAILNNLNSVLSAGIAGKNVTSTTTLKISTTDLNPPTSGGGTSNIAFLQGTKDGPNASAVQMDATFWIEQIRNADGSTTLQLQYSQRVLLNFNTLSWPHISVATLTLQPET
jgi:hypothetical protein